MNVVIEALKGKNAIMEFAKEENVTIAIANPETGLLGYLISAG